MSDKKSYYIAETNEAGQIEVVWVADAMGRGAHPVKSPARHLDLVRDAVCSGASSEAIQTWLHEKSQSIRHPG
jgi:hypothetical protein